MAKVEGHFTIKSKLKLDQLPVGFKLPESDYSTLTPDGNFVQLEYHEPERAKNIKEYDVKPGIWVMSHSQMQGMFLVETSFVQDSILEEFVHTKHINEKIDLFFKNVQVYYDLGFEVPKRGMLLYGPAGTGKSTAISKAVRRYDDGKTAIVVWPTSKYEAQIVKDFVKTFNYVGVERLILIVEDIGGVEVENAPRGMKSDSSLLSLLDNQEKTFKIPVFIIATTNHPEMFLANLTNRPNRFDDKIEVGFPESEFRVALLKFFSNKDKIRAATEEDLDFIASDKTEKFSPAHIREIVIKGMIYSKTYADVMKEMIKEIKTFENDFQKAPNRMGFNEYD